jgi:hypothetical protein
MAAKNGLVGRWHLVETDHWDQDALDLEQPAFVAFKADRTGELRMIAIEAWLDCRYSRRDGQPFVEFTWEGWDDSLPRSGRGWATLDKDGALSGRLFFHMGDESAFRAEPFAPSARRKKPPAEPPPF